MRNSNFLFWKKYHPIAYLEFWLLTPVNHCVKRIINMSLKEGKYIVFSNYKLEIHLNSENNNVNFYSIGYVLLLCNIKEM